MSNTINNPNEPLDTYISGRIIQEFRQRVGWTQAQLAAALSVQPTTVSRWETGLQDPRGDLRERLARLIQDVAAGEAVAAVRQRETVASDPDDPEVAAAGAAAIQRGLDAGLSPLAAWVLGWAARSHARGESPLVFLREREALARSSDEPAAHRSRDEATIHAIQQVGLWPWDGPH